MQLLHTSLKMTNVVTVISKFLNFVRSKGTNHRKFKYFLGDMESEYEDAPYCTKVRWFSRDRMCKSETELFLEINGKPFRQLCDHTVGCVT
jgi:hypothetical protein